MFYYTIKPGDTIYELAAKYNVPVSAILSANPGININNLLVGQQILIPVGLFNPAQNQQGGVSSGISASELKLRNDLRKLWEEHVAWTRMAILSAASNSPDLNLVVARLLRNASDMTAALQPLYGQTNATNFGRLIHDHLTIALQLVKAAKEGNTQAAQEAEKQWYANADQIANFLGTINPYISSNEFKKMLYTHLALTKDEAVERLKHNYAKDIALYDQIQDQALSMADMMAEGIIKQFPSSFR